MDVKQSSMTVSVGDEYEPLEFLVTPELNEQYLYAEQDYSPIYLADGSEEVAGIVHPGLLLNMSNYTRSPSYQLPPGVLELHAEDEVEFCRPAHVGDRLTVTWKVVGRDEKRGRIWHVTQISVTNQAGDEILKRRMTAMADPTPSVDKRSAS